MPGGSGQPGTSPTLPHLPSPASPPLRPSFLPKTCFCFLTKPNLSKQKTLLLQEGCLDHSRPAVSWIIGNCHSCTSKAKRSNVHHFMWFDLMLGSPCLLLNSPQFAVWDAQGQASDFLSVTVLSRAMCRSCCKRGFSAHWLTFYSFWL